MQSYQFWYDTQNQVFQLEHPKTKEDFFLNYKRVDNDLFVNGTIGDQHLNLKLKKMNLNDLPLLKNEFHWTIDAINNLLPCIF
jgi:hypothetical protein